MQQLQNCDKNVLHYSVCFTLLIGGLVTFLWHGLDVKNTYSTSFHLLGKQTLIVVDICIIVTRAELIVVGLLHFTGPWQQISDPHLMLLQYVS